MAIARRSITRRLPTRREGELASRTVPLAEAKRDLSDLCARARYARETIVITKHGQPVAAIISMEDLERAAVLEDRYAVELLERIIATSSGVVKVDSVYITRGNRLS